MEKMRDIIEIDENLCNGCGQCILDCAEGALKLVDGKAKLVGEFLCDGLGACLGGCPTGALKIIKRPAAAFDEEAVARHLEAAGGAPAPQQHACPGKAAMSFTPAAHATCPGSAAMSFQASPPLQTDQLACGCAGSAAGSFKPEAPAASGSYASTLGHWPIKLALLPPHAPFMQGADLALVADCAGLAWPDIHNKLLPGRAVAIACPKLDDAQAHIQKLAELLKAARPASLTVARMEVPCCQGLMRIAQEAVRLAGLNLPVREIVVSRQGKAMAEL